MMWAAGVLAALSQITYPSVSSYLSIHSDGDKQGTVQGIVTGIRGLCQGLGPALFGFIFYLFNVDLNTEDESVIGGAAFAPPGAGRPKFQNKNFFWTLSHAAKQNGDNSLLQFDNWNATSTMKTLSLSAVMTDENALWIAHQFFPSGSRSPTLARWARKRYLASRMTDDYSLIFLFHSPQLRVYYYSCVNFKLNEFHRKKTIPGPPFVFGALLVTCAILVLKFLPANPTSKFFRSFRQSSVIGSSGNGQQQKKDLLYSASDSTIKNAVALNQQIVARRYRAFSSNNRYLVDASATLLDFISDEEPIDEDDNGMFNNQPKTQINRQSVLPNEDVNDFSKLSSQQSTS
uniref:Uncharacterized protein n=1 Tax=Romanomermis culicivorax TaxID=13658 RepID=A0A915JEV2_ROMCU